MTTKQKKAKARLNKKIKEILDPEEYQKSIEVGRAKYDSVEDFVKAAIEAARWRRAREKAMKKIA
jgi:hypothetical protein